MRIVDVMRVENHYHLKSGMWGSDRLGNAGEMLMGRRGGHTFTRLLCQKVVRIMN